jgi:thiol:disulfide interchange protein DsbD
VELPRTDQRAFTLAVTYQGCADKGLCYPPETERLNINGDGATTARDWGWRELALFFLAGLGLTFTPCVLPMLPILSGVVLRGQVGGWRGFNLSLAYVLPMATCFALLGALMGLFGAQLNLQARLQSAWVLVPFAMFFAVFALAMFGVFELKLPHAISPPRSHRRTHRRRFVVGRRRAGRGLEPAGFTLRLGTSGRRAALHQRQRRCLGRRPETVHARPRHGRTVAAGGHGGAAWLPKSGPWLVYVKNAIGVLLLGLAIGLFSRVMPGQVTLLLIGLLAGGVGLFLGALEFVYKPPRKRLAQLLGLFLLFYALACWYGAFSGQTDPFNPIGQTRTVAGNPPAPNSNAWQTVSTPADLDRALAEARRRALRCCSTGTPTGASVAKSSNTKCSTTPRLLNGSRATG